MSDLVGNAKDPAAHRVLVCHILSKTISMAIFTLQLIIEGKLMVEKMGILQKLSAQEACQKIRLGRTIDRAQNDLKSVEWP